MAKRGKRYQEVVKLVDRADLLDPEEAIELIKRTATAKFDETIDLAARLGVDPRHADQNIRGAISLPHGTGKERRVLVFAKGEKALEAEESGADYVGGEELVEKVAGGWMDFDVVVATPDMMRFVGKLGKILGPKGMFPSPKTGTVTFEIADTVEEIKKGRVEYRVDRTGIVHGPIGKVSFPTEHLVENLLSFADVLIRARPAAVKGTYLKSLVLSSTMGPGIKLDTQKLSATVEKRR